ncbi:MAG: DNA-3-methyladenine glycosylase I [Gammaproteobacteria bacterium]|nr:DNA-3-methyladenine glycosylase I [Gammaproteobacteria bacterium]MBT4863438.1 DNA-3-methyladenine glycosylase I [Gammaproteobacteria bacterium]MBT6457881.1 DNA-3-methyladenine glycosylase I [Gammaproteobacteria bacterium]
MPARCGWVSDDPLYIEYHDHEWGKPQYDDQKLFEMLCLEGAQAGLSWITVLKKRAHYQKVFDDFNAQKIAFYSDEKRAELLQDAGIIRNKLKVNAFIVNAELYLEIKKHQSFKDYLWQFVDGEPVLNHWSSLQQVPVTTVQSDAMSKQLKKDGFKFIGSTICYAFMQATGMVNDHTTDCFCYKSLK